MSDENAALAIEATASTSMVSRLNGSIVRASDTTVPSSFW